MYHFTDSRSTVYSLHNKFKCILNFLNNYAHQRFLFSANTIVQIELRSMFCEQFRKEHSLLYSLFLALRPLIQHTFSAHARNHGDTLVFSGVIVQFLSQMLANTLSSEFSGSLKLMC